MGRDQVTALALVDELRQLPLEAVEGILRSLAPDEAAALWWEWESFWSREDQRQPPGFWVYWWLFGAKGTGKTRSAAQWVIARARAGLGPVMLVAGTDDDIRDTMVEGPTGILACSPPDFMPKWQVSKGGGKLVWPNHVTGRGFSAAEPDRFTGKASQTCWGDDLSAWGLHAKAVFDIMSWGLREGDARCVLTANPEETDLVLSLCDDPGRPIVVTESKLDANLANLSRGYEATIAQFKGTEQEQRHRFGKMIRTSASNPFRGIAFDAPPVRIHDAGELTRIAVSWDPADGAGPQHDDHGIGAAGAREDGHIVGLEDASADMEIPDAAEALLDILDRWADLYPAAQLEICAEVNRGERVVRGALEAAHWRRVAEKRSKRPLPEIVPVRAREGKVLKAGDLRGLYLGGLLHHLVGMGPAEAQQRGWNPLAAKRPKQDDRIDWLTQVVRHLARLDAGGPVREVWAPGPPAIEGRYANVDPRRPPARRARHDEA